MNASVVLVNPPVEKVIEEYDRPSYGHLGLAYLGGALRAAGLSCHIMDAKLGRIGYDEALGKLEELKPAIVGITSFTHEINLVERFSRDIKRRLPGTNIVMGGVHASSLPEETLRRLEAVDYIVKGEGEGPLVELALAILDGRRDAIPRIAGAGYRQGGGVAVSPQGPWAENLDALPFPAWDMFPQTMKTFPVITSRGCPFKCVFCARMMGERVRTRSPENVISELMELNGRYGAREVYFYDETFGFYADWLRSFTGLMVSSGLAKKIRWGITTRAHLLNSGTVGMMKKAGCVKIDFGVESGDDEILKKIKKNETKEDFIRAAKALKEAGIRSHSYYIIGHPYETARSALNTVDFAAALNTDLISIGIMIPYPGTEVAHLASRGEGGYKKLSSDWSDYNKQLGNALELESISRAELTKLQLAGYLKFYLKNFKIIPLLSASWKYRRLVVAIIAKYIRSVFNQKRAVGDI